MNHLYDYKKFAILYVDDEEKALKNFVRLFEDRFRIYTAPNAVEGLKALQEHKDDIGLLLTDQVMPGEKGVWLLEKSRQLQPRIIRILVTAFSDMTAAIAAVNTGAIYKYISKPWSQTEMETALKRGLEFFLVQRERDQLLREKLSVLHNMMIADRIVSLGLLAAGLSHHIRNALVAVKTFLDLAPTKMEQEKSKVNGLRDPDFWKEYYQNVQHQITRINNLLKDLWCASEKPAFDFKDQVQLRTVVSESIEQLRDNFTSRNLTVENLVPKELPVMHVDRPKFYRLFELLFKDEIASLPPGSRISIDASLRNGGPPENQEIQVVLQDNGPGIPKEALRLVFDPFVIRTDTPVEYGIHLMACYFIVHHHGGRVEARSEDGEGTSFILKLPVNPALAIQPAEETEFLQKVLLSDSLWEKLISSD